MCSSGFCSRSSSAARFVTGSVPPRRNIESPSRAAEPDSAGTRSDPLTRAGSLPPSQRDAQTSGIPSAVFIAARRRTSTSSGWRVVPGPQASAFTRKSTLLVATNRHSPSAACAQPRTACSHASALTTLRGIPRSQSGNAMPGDVAETSIGVSLTDFPREKESRKTQRLRGDREGRWLPGRRPQSRGGFCGPR